MLMYFPAVITCYIVYFYNHLGQQLFSSKCQQRNNSPFGPRIFPIYWWTLWLHAQL